MNVLLALVALASDDGRVIDVVDRYGTPNDGKADATATIQKALDEHAGSGRILYLRPGTYRITRPLKFRKGDGIWGYTNLWGAGRTKTTLRLDDATFTNTDQPQPVLTLQAHGSADWFHNSAQRLSIETGRHNPCAIGIEFFSNNTGVLRDVSIRSEDGQSYIGLQTGLR
jgi:hypothetical protein